MNTRTLICALLAVFAFGARADDPQSEIRQLRQQIEQQAAELERLRAAVQRLEAAPALPPQTSSSTLPAPAPLKFSGLLQGWAVTGDAAFMDTFRVRRAELKLAGDLGRNAGWTLMVDGAKALSHTSSGAINQSGRILQDAFITVGSPAKLQLTAGQFKLPLSREGLESSAALDTVERSLFMSDRTRAGSYGDIRDVGVSLRRSVADRYEVSLGLFNAVGESQNDVDRNERKALAGRVAVPIAAVNGLRLGASGAWGGGSGADRRDRAGVDVLYTRGRWKFKGEAMAGRDGAVDRFGAYAHVGARVSQRLELVARADQWDPDTASDRDQATALERDYILGGNITLAPALRLQANFVHKTWESDAVSDRNLLLLNLQTSW